MLPDLNRLRVFYYIYQGSSITEAAGSLNITPSAVSQQLKKLENDLKAPLFTRLHKRLVPTSAGRQLFNLISPLITGLDDGLCALAKGRSQPSGLLKIGAPVEFGSIYLPHVIAAYRMRFPHVTFDLELGRPSDLLPKVSSGDLDFAFVDMFLTSTRHYSDFGSFSAEPVIEEELVLACSQTYDREGLNHDHTYRKLAGATFISQQRDTRGLLKWFRHHFDKTPSRLAVALTVANHQAVVSAVRHHAGLGIVVSHLVRQDIQSGRIVVIRGSAPQAVNLISIVQLLDKIPPLTEKTFLKHFFQMVRKSKTLRQLNLGVGDRK